MNITGCDTDKQRFIEDLQLLNYQATETDNGGVIVSREAVSLDLTGFDLYPKEEIWNNYDCCIAHKANETGTYSTVLKFYPYGIKVLFDVQVQKDQD